VEAGDTGVLDYVNDCIHRALDFIAPAKAVMNGDGLEEGESWVSGCQRCIRES